jgi:glycosyltransferase involved in cell wall biosynthesis
MLHKDALFTVHSNYHPDNRGGIESVVRQIIDLLTQEGIHSQCFFGHIENMKSSGNVSCDFYGRRILAKYRGASVLSLGNLKFFQLARKSSVIIYQEPYPTLWPAMFLLRRMLRIRTIVILHADPASHPVVRRMYRSIRAIVFKGATLVATSPDLANQVRSSAFESTRVIPLTIPPHMQRSCDSLQLPARYCLFIGRLVEYKGVELVVEAAQRTPSVQYVIAGDGPLANSLKRFIRIKSINNIVFLNKVVSEDDKFELIERCDFLLFPSVSENEAFGLVQLEAMRQGKPIVNTRLNNGVNYVAPDQECAITVEPRNIAELAAATERLWRDRGLQNILGTNAKRRFDTLFSQEFFVSSWRDVLFAASSR